MMPLPYRDYRVALQFLVTYMPFQKNEMRCADWRGCGSIGHQKSSHHITPNFNFSNEKTASKGTIYDRRLPVLELEVLRCHDVVASYTNHTIDRCIKYKIIYIYKVHSKNGCYIMIRCHMLRSM